MTNKSRVWCRRPDFRQPFYLFTDASDRAAGMVLVQRDSAEGWLVVACASRAFNLAERKKTTTEKELLAMVYGLKKFHPYIWGRPVTVVTDHQALEWLFRRSELTAQQERWMALTSEYAI